MKVVKMGKKPAEISRKQQLINILGDDSRNLKMIDYVVGLEERIDALDHGDKDGTAPFYEVNPKNPQQQRVNPTFKAYKELLQQYTNCYKALFKGADAEDSKEDTPLREWARMRNAKK